MRKVSSIPLLFGFVGALVCSMSSQIAQALDGQAQGDARALGPTATQQHVHRLAKHAASSTRKKFVAVAQDGAVPAALPTQPDIVAPSRPPVPPIPPTVDAILRAATGQNPAAQTPTAQNPAADARPVVPAKATQHPDAADAKPGSEAKESQHPAAVAEKPKPPAPLPREIQQFCANTASAAVDARVAWEAAKLVELEARLRQRIAEFEAKRAEYEDWLHKHDEAMKEANEDVVSIYSRMRPDAAAAQLAVMDDVTAASVLAKLNSRVASAILAEMDPGRAARIANAMVGPVSAAGGKKS